ncbi:hypothetical protein SDJN02_25330, partial [Cucurbita argyrosperma subsp. argyrosperma]
MAGNNGGLEDFNEIHWRNLKSEGGCKVLRSSMTEAEKITEEQAAIVKRNKMKFADIAAIDDSEILRLSF